MSFEERIRSSYPLHTQLIATLTTTSNASNRVNATTQYIYELRSRIEVSTKKLRALRSVVNTLRSEYEVLRDSLAKRLICKVSGKIGEYEAKTSSAERTYQDALEEQARTATDLEALHVSLKEANQDLINAKDQAAIYKFTVLELDALHNKLFPPSSTNLISPLPSLFRIPQLYSTTITRRTPYALEVRAHAQIHSLTSGPLAKLRSQIKHEKRVLDQLLEARKSLIWAHAAILDAEDADRHCDGTMHEYRSLGMVLVRTTLGVAQCHAVRGVAAYEAARALRAGCEGRSGNARGRGRGSGSGSGHGNSGDGSAELPPLRELMIMDEMCLMTPVTYPLPLSPTSPASGSLLSPGSRSLPGLSPGLSPSALPSPGSAAASGARARGSSTSAGGESESGSGGGGSVSTSMRRLLDDKDLGARIVEFKAEIRPTIVQVRHEIAAVEARVAALEDGRRALESEARDVLRRARIGVVEMIVSGGGESGREGAMDDDDDENSHSGGEDVEEVQVFMGGPPDYTP